VNDSTTLAVALLAALRRGGVSDVVLSPGSRSAALAVVLHQADAEGLLRLHVRIDERTAGFLALGLAKGSHRPVAVITTSGTAVVNLHPAVLEAAHAGERLLVISADRPAGLRGTGANQTTDPIGIFGPHVPCVDVPVKGISALTSAVDAAVAAVGPTHLNLQFAEPLLPHAMPVDLAEIRARPAAGQPPGRQPARPDGSDGSDGTARLPRGPRTVVVAGDDAGPPARLLAEAANWPLLAEPTSGARTGTHAIRTYRLLLDTELGQRIERVVVTGHPTLSRPVTRLISRSDLEVVSVAGPAGAVTDPGRVARSLDAMPAVEGADPSEWVEQWRAADRELAGRLDAFVRDDPDAAPLRVAAEVAAAVTPGALLIVGSSQPIRDLDLMAEPWPAGQRRLVVANRGLAGIDGTVSTAVGAALGRRSSRAIAYLGDLTFLHDANGLVLGPDEPRPALTIVVANDDGGAIFAGLEQGADAYAAGYERVFGTPHAVDLEALCRSSGTAYCRASSPEELRRRLGDPSTGIRVIEVPLSRAGRRRLAAEIAGLATPS
jgi:2-succinyl-5-enolpyruvyl-6-hydroxy-3-cyclohexene-1-carboxylate synthase